MNTVDESLNHLIEAVRNSKEFQDYQIVKAKVEKYPEKKRSLDKYRTRMYKIQNNHGETDLYHHIDEIERESERFRQDNGRARALPHGAADQLDTDRRTAL